MGLEKTVSTAGERRSFRFERSVAALGISAVVLSGCNDTARAFNWAQSGHDQIYATYPCDPAIDSMILSESISIEAANRCIEDRNKPIALVNFGMPADFAGNVASRGEVNIEDAYDNLLDASIVVVEPSPEALAMYNLRHSQEGCYNDMTLGGFGAYIADTTMDLDNYGVVVALNDDVSCIGLLGATPNENHRVLDIFQPREGTHNEDRAELSAQILAHEFGHAKFGLAHNGEMFGGDYKLDYKSPNGGMFNALPKMDGMDIVNDILKNNSYIVYGDDPNVMGGDYADPPFNLNGTQRHQIRWAERKLSGEPDPEIMISPTETALEWPADKQHQYTYLPLREPLRVQGYLLTDSNGLIYNLKGIETNDFTRLVFDPLVEDDNRVRLLQVYLTGQDGVTLSLGHIKNDNQQPEAYNFTVGTQKVDLSVNKLGYTVKSNV